MQILFKRFNNIDIWIRRYPITIFQAAVFAIHHETWLAWALLICAPSADRQFRRAEMAEIWCSELWKVLRFIEAPTRPLDLTLDIRGTHFQKRVWSALCGVPSGSTITYAALAARIGEPKAVRAVANACAANAIALAIPCHRVIRKDGTFSGYRWGEERKRMLIAREALL